MPLQGRKEKEESTPVDFSKGLPWKGTKNKLDPEQDAWKRGAPPLPGVYNVDLAVNAATLEKPKPSDESTWYFMINIEGRISDEGDYKGIPGFMRVNTRIKRGADTSTAYGAIVKLLGVDIAKSKIPSEVEPGVIAKTLVNLINKGAKAKWEFGWRAGYSDSKGRWHTVCSTYDEFPESPEGGKESTVVVTTVDGGKEVISANSNITAWFGKGETVESKTKPVLKGDDLDLGEGVQVAAASAGAPVKANSHAKEEVSDELEL